MFFITCQKRKKIHAHVDLVGEISICFLVYFWFIRRYDMPFFHKGKEKLRYAIYNSIYLSPKCSKDLNILHHITWLKYCIFHLKICEADNILRQISFYLGAINLTSNCYHLFAVLLFSWGKTFWAPKGKWPWLFVVELWK